MDTITYWTYNLSQFSLADVPLSYSRENKYNLISRKLKNDVLSCGNIKWSNKVILYMRTTRFEI